MNTTSAIHTTSSQGVFVDNRWHEPASGETQSVVAPAKGVAFAQVASG